MYEKMFSLRNLGILFDSHLSFDNQISSVCKSSNWHIHDLWRIRSTLDLNTTKTIATSLVHSKLDYCNSLYLNLPAYQLARLQCIQNSLARVVCKIPKHHHITPSLRSLHWLKIPPTHPLQTPLHHLHPYPTPAAIISLLPNRHPVCTFHSVIINPNTQSSSSFHS